jgi:hypothetical protein
MQDLVGKRIKLIKMIYTHPVPSGTKGRVTEVDNIGLIHVKWDSNKDKPLPMRGLCIDPDVDTFEILG